MLVADVGSVSIWGRLMLYVRHGRCGGQEMSVEGLLAQAQL